MNEINEAQAFGIFRAEYLNEQLYKMFAVPGYFPELQTHRPCILIGGRGTGKTTVLKCLSYTGKFELEKKDESTVKDWPYYGFYYRVNTNRVMSFQDETLTEKQWEKVFGHYINMILCEKVIAFIDWYCNIYPECERLSSERCHQVCQSLFISDANSQESLLNSIVNGRRSFENFLNNIDSTSLPKLSLQGQPIDELCEALLQLPQFKDKSFFFIIDEFENFLDYQQVIINTLIKHCGAYYTFKIGVKELGWRKRATLNPNEQLQSPADYERIDIAERLDADNFKKFATDVCLIRARKIPRLYNITDLSEVFKSLEAKEEANKLGVKNISDKIRIQMKNDGISEEQINQIEDLEIYFIDFWKRNKSINYKKVLTERECEFTGWRNRYDNYRHAILYEIRSGKSGIRKYYCGWKTFISMANGNIRFLLQLVNEAIILHSRSNESELVEISPETQTKAAQIIGKKNLSELEGLSIHGAQITKLLLGLGRIFETLASSPLNHAPEYTQFHFADGVKLGNQAEDLITASVMHLALYRSISSKRMDFDLKSHDYSIHPIYSAFFNFSHRKKRKISIQETDFIDLIQQPRDSIKKILKKNGVNEFESLPEQMQLFSNYYN